MNRICLISRSVTSSMEISKILSSRRIRVFFTGPEQLPSEKFEDFSHIIISEKSGNHSQSLGEWVFLCKKPILVLGNSTGEIKDLAGEKCPKGEENGKIEMGNIILFRKFYKKRVGKMYRGISNVIINFGATFNDQILPKIIYLSREIYLSNFFF